MHRQSIIIRPYVGYYGRVTRHIMRRGRWRSSLIITHAIKRSSSRDAVSIASIQEEKSVQNCPRSTLTTQRWPSVNRSTCERYFILDLRKLAFKRYWLSQLQTKERLLQQLITKTLNCPMTSPILLEKVI